MMFALACPGDGRHQELLRGSRKHPAPTPLHPAEDSCFTLGADSSTSLRLWHEFAPAVDAKGDGPM